MGRLGTNLFANVLGTGWAGVVQVVCVPLYVKILGMEAYGLVGFFVALQATLRILDLGLSPTMTREIARYSVQPDRVNEMRDFARTMELTYWAIGIVVGAVLCAISGLIATKWINGGSLPLMEVKRSLLIIGIVTAAQWPLSLYQGGLAGLQHQPLLNAIKVGGATLNGVAIILVLLLVSSNVTAFFLTQLVTSVIQTIATAIAFWKCVPSSHRVAKFNAGAIWRISHFVGGMSGIGLFGMLLTQMDKIVLSKVLPLSTFGRYTLAAFVANSLQLFITPIFSVIFPRLSALIMSGNKAAVRDLYHDGTQLMSVLMVPCATVVMLLTIPVMFAWTGNMGLAGQVATITALLTAGTAVNGIMYMPFSLQLAYGWTTLALWTTASMCVVFLPMLYFAVVKYGPVGAASVWLILNIVGIVVVVAVTHSKLLRGETLQWALQDIGVPTLAVVAVVFAARRLFGVPGGRGIAAAEVTVTIAFAVIAAALCAPRVRAPLLRWGRQVALTG
jgi:O-antigen/teichoic acid export membrane protein